MNSFTPTRTTNTSNSTNCNNANLELAPDELDANIAELINNDGLQVIGVTNNSGALYLAEDETYDPLIDISITSADKSSNPPSSIVDDPCTSNFLSAKSPFTSKQAEHIPLSVKMPNGTSIQSSHTCDLLLTDLPPQARKSHVLSGIVHNSLISVGQLCDNGCDISFNKERVSVTNNGKCIMLGACDPQSDLW
jgi:hypothetical protein